MSAPIPVLVSACLLGTPCRYDGRSVPVPAVIALASDPRVRLIPVCPEQAGGLPTPRTPAERQGERVVTRDGRDVTRAYRLGAADALAKARESGARVAILKQKSPSCGSHEIYDGTFTRSLRMGRGVCCEVLEANGIRVFSEEEIGAALALLFPG